MHIIYAIQVLSSLSEWENIRIQMQDHTVYFEIRHKGA